MCTPIYIVLYIDYRCIYSYKLLLAQREVLPQCSIIHQLDEIKIFMKLIKKFLKFIKCSNIPSGKYSRNTKKLCPLNMRDKKLGKIVEHGRRHTQPNATHAKIQLLKEKLLIS